MCVKLYPDPKWCLYIGSIDKDAGEIVGSMYCSVKYQTLREILCGYKKQIRHKMEARFPGSIEFKIISVYFWVTNYFIH